MVTTNPASEGTEGILPWSDRLEDFWDRPEGDWGDAPGSDAVLEARCHANSCYRLGSFALDIKQPGLAANWLHAAMKEDHPGAWFRTAVVVSRRGPAVFGDGAFDYIRYLVRRAADLGHGDAQQMRPLLVDQAADVPTLTTWEDPEYGPEVLAALRTG
ncbi:hypothetical protein ACFQ9Q_11675 [Streptomyces virginiae]|uniref:hypothetical protein n=1 Tax=Streptomyces virginiae TaxID=1961 RepID=UPI0036A540D6